MNKNDEDGGHEDPKAVSVASHALPQGHHDQDSLSSPDPEAGPRDDLPVVDDHHGDLVTAAENKNLKRGLAERHLTMLGIAGAIGTGLFLSLGGAIQTGGPLGALLGYAMVGGIVCAVQFALGEVTALLPVRPDSVDSARHNWSLPLAVADSFSGHRQLRPSCRLSR